MTSTGKLKANRTTIRMLIPVLLILLILFLSSCGGNEAPVNEPSNDVVADEPAEEPAEEPVGPRPTPTPKPIPTIAPQDRIEDWLVGLEWPSEMFLSESDVIRLTLTPTEEGLVMEAEFSDHRTVMKEVPIERPTGYLLVAVAEVHAPNFETSPEGPQKRELVTGKEETWHWTITPTEPGWQRISLSLQMEWQALEGQSPETRNFGTFSQGLEMYVDSIMGMSKSTAMTVFSVLAISILLLGVVYLRTRKKTQIIQIGTPNPALQIDRLPEITLSNQETKLLQTGFREYQRVIVEREFMSGYSGARTFMLTPVRKDERSDARTIIKVSDKKSIRREYLNYQRYVKSTLPPTTARIQQQPVALKNDPLAALQYTFIGMPGETPLSLRQQLLVENDPEWFNKLVDTYGPTWWMQKTPYVFRLGYEYDRKLPAHLVIRPVEGEGKTISGKRSPYGLEVLPGEIVNLVDFEVRSMNPAKGKFSLIGNPQEGNPPIRVSYMADHLPDRVSGRVIDTRVSFLNEQTKNFERDRYPDPIPLLTDLLTETVQFSRSIIHGDLNLENILIGPGNLIWLIDFAETREGHTLFDFTHLYVEVIAHILSQQVSGPDEFCDKFESREFASLNRIEEIGARFSHDPASRREFYLAAVLSCLGALKYENLTTAAKHYLYLTAALLSYQL